MKYSTIEFATKKEAKKRIELMKDTCKDMSIVKTLNDKYKITFNK